MTAHIQTHLAETIRFHANSERGEVQEDKRFETDILQYIKYE